MSFKRELSVWDPCRPESEDLAAVGATATLGVELGRICDRKDFPRPVAPPDTAARSPPHAVAPVSHRAMPPAAIINHVRKFNGTNYPLAEWAEQLRVLEGMYAVEPLTLAELAIFTLEGPAWTTARLETVRGHRTLDDLICVLESSYGSTVCPGALRLRFFRRTQLEGEDIPQYANALQVLMEKICERGETALGSSPRDELLRDQFVLGLRDQYLNRALQDLTRLNPRLTFQAVKREAIERTRAALPGETTVRADCSLMEETKVTERDKENESLRQRVAVLEEQLSRFTLQEPPRRPEPRRRQEEPYRSPRRCFSCGDPGHLAAGCPQRRPRRQYHPLN